MRKPTIAAVGGVTTAMASGLCCAGPLLHREEQIACAPGKACADPAVRRRMRTTLRAATVSALVLGSFPWWSQFVFPFVFP